MAKKLTHKLGDKCFSVSWIPAESVTIEDGDHDLDQAESVRVRRLFPTEAVAMQFSRTVNDFYGCPSVYEMEFTFWDEHSQECMERPDWKAVREIEVPEVQQHGR